MEHAIRCAPEPGRRRGAAAEHVVHLLPPLTSPRRCRTRLQRPRRRALCRRPAPAPPAGLRLPAPGHPLNGRSRRRVPTAPGGSRTEAPSEAPVRRRRRGRRTGSATDVARPHRLRRRRRQRPQRQRPTPDRHRSASPRRRPARRLPAGRRGSPRPGRRRAPGEGRRGWRRASRPGRRVPGDPASSRCRRTRLLAVERLAGRKAAPDGAEAVAHAVVAARPGPVAAVPASSSGARLEACLDRRLQRSAARCRSSPTRARPWPRARPGTAPARPEAS